MVSGEQLQKNGLLLLICLRHDQSPIALLLRSFVVPEVTSCTGVASLGMPSMAVKSFNGVCNEPIIARKSFWERNTNMATLIPALGTCVSRMTAGERRLAERLEQKLDEDKDDDGIPLIIRLPTM